MLGLHSLSQAIDTFSEVRLIKFDFMACDHQLMPCFSLHAVISACIQQQQQFQQLNPLLHKQISLGEEQASKNIA